MTPPRPPPSRRLLQGLLLAACLGPGCATPRQGLPDGWERLPEAELAASASADQRAALARQGPPTTRWRTRLWTERWVYCPGARVVRVLEFDSQGDFLSEANGGNPLLCAGEPLTLRERSQAAFLARNLRASGALETTDAEGRTRTMEFVFFSKSDAAGLHQRRLLALVAPQELRGAGLVVLQDDGTHLSLWSRTPGSPRPRLLESEELLGAFAGSDLSPADLLFTGDELFLHEVLRTESLPEGEMLVIETTPRPAAGLSWYGRTLSWVGEDRQVLAQVEFYDSQGGLQKTLRGSEPREIDPQAHLWLPTRLSITNHRDHTRTEVRIEAVRTDLELQDELFTPEQLERGGK